LAEELIDGNFCEGLEEQYSKHSLEEELEDSRKEDNDRNNPHFWRMNGVGYTHVREWEMMVR